MLSRLLMLVRLRERERSAATSQTCILIDHQPLRGNLGRLFAFLGVEMGGERVYIVLGSLLSIPVADSTRPYDPSLCAAAASGGSPSLIPLNSRQAQQEVQDERA